MNLESALNYLTHHIEPIIQWLFFAILLLSAFLIVRWLFGKKGEDAGLSANSVTLADGGDIQTFLKKILDQTTKLENLPLEGLSSAGAGEMDARIQAIKLELASRDAEIVKLKAGGDSKSSADADVVNSRIKELESKLAEYEILEDDIADLSLYKEENARLKDELEKAKTSSPIALAAESMPVSAPPTSGDDIVAEFAEAVGQEATSEATAVAAPMVIPETGDPMADFESVVALEKKVTSAPPAVVAAPPPEPEPAVEGDDLFGEFAAAPKAEDEGSLDTDKMMAEMAALVSVDSTGDASGGLEEMSDIEKMAAEATNLSKP